MHAILKQIAQQLKGYSKGSDDEAYTLLYPFDLSRDYYSTPWKAFTDPRNGKEHILKLECIVIMLSDTDFCIILVRIGLK